jgi:hypothetical protein
MLYKANSKSKLKEDKKWSYLKLITHSSREDSKGKLIKHKKLDNGKTKLGRYNK